MVQFGFNAGAGSGNQSSGAYAQAGRSSKAQAFAHSPTGDASAFASSGRDYGKQRAGDTPTDSYQSGSEQPCDDALKQLIGRFDEFDTNHDGALEDKELANAQTQMNDCKDEIGDIRKNKDELIFSSVDPGNAAWHGLTQNDLNVMKDKRDDQPYQSQGDNLRGKISTERRVPGSVNGFRQYVRDTASRRPI